MGNVKCRTLNYGRLSTIIIYTRLTHLRNTYLHVVFSSRNVELYNWLITEFVTKRENNYDQKPNFCHKFYYRALKYSKSKSTSDAV